MTAPSWFGDSRDGSVPFLAMLCGFGFFAAAMVVTADANLLGRGKLLSAGIWMAAALIGAVAGFGLFRLLGFRRRPLTPRLALVAVVLTFVGVWGVQRASSHVFMSAWDRYTAELGGDGACLSGTPYSDKQAMVVMKAAPGNDRMEVWPGGPAPKGRTYPVLKLKHAVNGGTQPLAPADEKSQDLLRSYGCH
ncbi:hypothetical protein [Streptomyces xanthii]|uniref:hypothetical protein n=1 Tax=Streptomyces xanthii TaxID=2768069 RepID=UPI001CB779BB|nr:hypothetical protein [Streptomyces xanthii]